MSPCEGFPKPPYIRGNLSLDIVYTLVFIQVFSVQQFGLCNCIVIASFLP